VQRVADEFGVTHPHRALIVEGGGSSEGYWDEARLEQVLANLIGNALRHGDPRQPVRVRWRGAPDTLLLEVHNGGAIPASLREHLFDPFRRGTPSRDSLGLGLYIVRQIVLSHSGSIDVASSDADGTTFRVRLPRRVPSALSSDEPSTLGDASAPRGDAGAASAPYRAGAMLHIWLGGRVPSRDLPPPRRATRGAGAQPPSRRARQAQWPSARA
jgi:hypothetical protein